MRINGHVLEELVLDRPDWKTRRTSEVAKFLKAGENEISVTVYQFTRARPRSGFRLEGGALTLHSGSDWQVSLVGAVWQKAALASEPPAIRRGNPLFGRERMLDSLRRTWP